MSDRTMTPDGFRLAQCGSCNAAIIWASTANNRSMPVDAEPSDDGNVEVRHELGRVVADVLTAEPMFAVGVRRKSHFATCPDSDTWRKRDHA